VLCCPASTSVRSRGCPSPDNNAVSLCLILEATVEERVMDCFAVL
jgi:hypothetical protein